MKYKELYENTIWQVMESLSAYKQYIERNDLNGLYKVKRQLVADKTILNQIYADSCGFYTEKKRSTDIKKDELYLEYRKTESQGDAEKMAKIDCKEDYRTVDDYKVKRNKTQKLLEDVKDVIIEIAVLLRDKENQEKYG